MGIGAVAQAQSSRIAEYGKDEKFPEGIFRKIPVVLQAVAGVHERLDERKKARVFCGMVAFDIGWGSGSSVIRGEVFPQIQERPQIFILHLSAIPIRI